MSTANYGWDHIATNQASKEVTANGVFDDIDAQVKANHDLTEKLANKNSSYPGLVATPANAGATGIAGQIAYDSTHIYVCVATDTWVRAVLATW